MGAAASFLCSIGKPEPEKEPALSELDTEIECPRYNEIMSILGISMLMTLRVRPNPAVDG